MAPRSVAVRRVPATGSERQTAGSSTSATPTSTAPRVARRSTSRWSAWPAHRQATAIGWWRRTAAYCPRRRIVLRLHGRPAPEPADRGHGGHADRRGLLAGG